MKNYKMNVEVVDEIINEMYDGGDGICCMDEIVKVVCGEEYRGGRYGEKELEYVKEVMRECYKVNVEFDDYNEVMYIESEVKD